jgi:FixJ family two-component response regulator
MIAAGPPGSTDTVVVDLGLPGISGSRLLAWLGALAVRPRVFVISGKSSGTIARETEHVPQFPVLRKPPAADWLDIIVG